MCKVHKLKFVDYVYVMSVNLFFTLMIRLECFFFFFFNKQQHQQFEGEFSISSFYYNKSEHNFEIPIQQSYHILKWRLIKSIHIHKTTIFSTYIAITERTNVILKKICLKLNFQNGFKQFNGNSCLIFSSFFHLN